MQTPPGVQTAGIMPMWEEKVNLETERQVNAKDNKN